MQDASEKRACACPLNGTTCIDGIRDDFAKGPDGRQLKCRWWTHLFGKDPQADKQIDQWDCSIAWLPITTIEAAQMSRQTGSSVDKVANQIAEVKQGITAMSGALRVAAAGISQAVEAGALNIMLPAPSQEGETTNGHDKS